MDSVQETIRRTQRYWYVDGLTEIVMGFFLLILAAYFWLADLVVGPAHNWLLGIGQPLLVFLAVYGGNRVVRALKERLTYRRTGYVAYRKPTPRRRVYNILFSLIVALGMGMFVAMLGNLMPERWLAGTAGGLMALVLVLIGVQMGLNRFYFLAGFVLLAGLIVTAWAPGEPWDFAALFGAFGLGSITSGAWTLSQYLRHSHPTQEGVI